MLLGKNIESPGGLAHCQPKAKPKLAKIFNSCWRYSLNQGVKEVELDKTDYWLQIVFGGALVALNWLLSKILRKKTPFCSSVFRVNKLMWLSHRGTLIKKFNYAPQLYDTWRVWKLGHFTILYIFVNDVGLSLKLRIWFPYGFHSFLSWFSMMKKGGIVHMGWV